MIASLKSIPRPVIRRFHEYLACLERIRMRGRRWINSRELADVIGMTRSTVRQDVSYLDFSATGRNGYEIEMMEYVITRTLRLEVPAIAVIGGGGELARVLALNSGRRFRAFEIAGIFDWRSSLVGTRVGKWVVRDSECMPKIVRSRKVEIGIVASNAEAAQTMANLLVSAGVRGVLNFSPTPVAVPPGISFLDASMVPALLELVHEVRAGTRKKKASVELGARQ
jgi:redox-sensing transcriptional repressor